MAYNSKHQQPARKTHGQEALERVVHVLRPPNSLPTSGTITRLLHDVQAGKPSAEDDLWEAVIEQLILAARRMLRQYPQALQDPQELLGDLWERMSRFLARYDVANRTHFFNAACRHMRFLLLDLTRVRRNAQHSELTGTHLADPDTGPVDHAAAQEQLDQLQQAVRTLGQLRPELQDVIHYHIFLDMSFREIEDFTGIRRATANDRYRKALEELERIMAGERGTQTS